MKRFLRSGKAPLWLALLLVFLAPASGAHSVLTDEQVVDLLGEDRLQPLLKACLP